MRYRFAVALVALLATAASHTAQAEPLDPDKIAWRLKNPFRYFKSAAATEEHIQAYQALTGDEKASPSLAIEHRLAEKSGGWGWAGAVYTDVADESCWYSNSAHNAEGGTACGNYVRPAFHPVLISAPSVAGACTWEAGGTTVPASDCTKPAELPIPYPAGAEVTLAVDGKAIARRTIAVTDILVLGLGDSFGSGEGNPDRPVSFRQRRSMDYAGSEFPRDEFAGYPLRDGIPRGADEKHSAFASKGAGWLHRNCHRSLYSQQLRTALLLAISDPDLQRSVTYLGFACSGSTILSLFDRYNGIAEPRVAGEPAHASRDLALSQLSIASHALCKPGTVKKDEATDYNALDGQAQLLELGSRKIPLFACAEKDRLRPVDVLLLSAGGNDVGFSGLVANAALDPAYLGLPRLFKEDPTVDPKRAEAYLERLPGRYSALAHALKTALGIVDPARVFLTAYPRLAAAEGDGRCSKGNSGMDVTRAWKISPAVVERTEQFVEEKFTPVMKEAAEAHGWTFVAEHRGKAFVGHELCAPEPETNNGPVANPKFPRYYTATGVVRWRPFTPDLFRPYAVTRRYYRTPNDAFLTAHHHGREATISRGGRLLQITSWSAYSGAFHPNALGHAAIADAVAPQVEAQLKARAAKPAP